MAAVDGGLSATPFFYFPSRAVWAAPTLHQLRLLGFSFLNSSFGRGGRIRTSDLTLGCPNLFRFQLGPVESGEKVLIIIIIPIIITETLLEGTYK